MTQPVVVDEPVPLVVPVEKVANRLRLDVPVDDETEQAITGALLDAQAEVEGYLGRPITPTQFVQTNCIAYADGWHLSESKIISVDSVVPELDPINNQPTGRYTVTYTAGIDARQAVYLPIRRYVEHAALQSGDVIRLWQAKQGAAAKRIRSSSVEGQSVSYDYLTPGGVENRSAPGSGAPTLRSLDRWRLAGRRAFQRPGRAPVSRAYNE